MGTSESKAGATKFFYGVGGILEKGANTAIGIASIPVKLANTAENFLNNPLSLIIIPVVIVGGLYVISQR